MKKLILAVMTLGFAVAVHAGEGCCSTSGSCGSKMQTSTETKAQCPMAKQQVSANKCTAHKANRVVSSKLQSPKAASLAS